MKHIFIDLGCYKGESIVKFLEANPYQPWHIYAFDPNPDAVTDMMDLFKELPTLFYYEKAAWTYDGDVEFTIRPPESPLGSTVMKNKRDWGMGDIIRVGCIDFSKWLKKTVAKDDYVVLKMDIEGAEYDVLDHMIKDNTMKLVDRLLIEWHGSKLKDLDQGMERRVWEGLEKSGVTVKDWI